MDGIDGRSDDKFVFVLLTLAIGRTFSGGTVPGGAGNILQDLGQGCRSGPERVGKPMVSSETGDIDRLCPTRMPRRQGFRLLDGK